MAEHAGVAFLPKRHHRFFAQNQKCAINFTGTPMAAEKPLLIRETFPVGPLQCNCNDARLVITLTHKVFV
jgi:hypothetical protein